MNKNNNNNKNMSSQITENKFQPIDINEILKHQIKHSNSLKNNINKTKYSSILHKSDNFGSLSNENLKNYLVVHKINIKDNTNTFYKKALNDVFFDKKYYFTNEYFNHKIKIGSLKNLALPREKTNRIKDFSTNKYRKLSTSDNPFKYLYAKNKILDSTNESILSKYDFQRQINKKLLKRPSFLISGKEYITDGELKLLYQRYKNKKKNIKSKMTFRNDKNNLLDNNTFYCTSMKNEINNRLFLQEKILNNYKKYKKLNHYLTNKIKKVTKKTNENILINKINTERKKNEGNNLTSNDNGYNVYHRKIIQWLSNLRSYNNKNNSENKNNKIIDNARNDNLNKNYFNKTMINSNSEKFKNNYINKYNYSFGNDKNLYSDIESKIAPLFALVIPENLKSEQIIKNSFIDDIDNESMNKNDRNREEKLMIEGKNLLDYEIELSKELEGKKKYFIKNNNKEDDIKPLNFSKKYVDYKYNIPKTVKNALNSHLIKY